MIHWEDLAARQHFLLLSQLDTPSSPHPQPVFPRLSLKLPLWSQSNILPVTLKNSILFNYPPLSKGQKVKTAALLLHIIVYTIGRADVADRPLPVAARSVVSLLCGWRQTGGGLNYLDIV